MNINHYRRILWVVVYTVSEYTDVCNQQSFTAFSPQNHRHLTHYVYPNFFSMQVEIHSAAAELTMLVCLLIQSYANWTIVAMRRRPLNATKQTSVGMISWLLSTRKRAYCTYTLWNVSGLPPNSVVFLFKQKIETLLNRLECCNFHPESVHLPLPPLTGVFLISGLF